MYRKILVTLDTTSADRTILEHIRPLAKLCQSKIVLMHVADGWAARLHGKDAVSPEITQDQAYLDKVQRELTADGLDVEAVLAYGDPAREIVRWVREEKCDLIAMSTHGHRFLADLFLGSPAEHVRHRVNVPVLLVKARGGCRTLWRALS
jgi:nucleotide-binding universal stress UspA family protein